jgi:hypothetical protein
VKYGIRFLAALSDGERPDKRSTGWHLLRSYRRFPGAPAAYPKLGATQGHNNKYMSGTAIFLWHDGKPRYDEVIWDPRPVTPDQAAGIASARMKLDRRATRIQVSYSETEFYEVVRA